MRLALALALVLAAGAALADAPEVSPRPLPNPALAAGAAKVTVTMSMADHPRAATRPPARPEVAETDVATAVAAKPVTLKSALGSLFPLDAVPRPPKKPKINVTGEEIEDVSYRTQPGPEIIVGRKGSVCGDPAIRGMSVAPIAGRLNGCGLSDGVKVTSVDGVPLSVPATIDCTTALALRSWVTDGLKPVVGKRGGGVARIEVAGQLCLPPAQQPVGPADQRTRARQGGRHHRDHPEGRRGDHGAARLGPRQAGRDSCRHPTGWPATASGPCSDLLRTVFTATISISTRRRTGARAGTAGSGPWRSLRGRGRVRVETARGSSCRTGRQVAVPAPSGRRKARHIGSDPRPMSGRLPVR